MNRVGSDGKEVWNGEETNLQIVNYTPETDEDLIDEMIPFEMLSNIFSRLSDKDIENTCLTSHYWKDVSVDAVTYKEFSKIKDFAYFLAQCLENEPNAESFAVEINRLYSLSSETRYSTIENLVLAKTYFFSLKEIILDILKNVGIDLAHLEKLAKNEPKPKFFDDLFALARFYQKIEKVKNGELVHCPLDEFHSILKSSSQRGDFTKVMEFINILKDDFHKMEFVRSLWNELCRSKNFDKAIEFFDRLSKNYCKDEVLKGICEDFFRNGNFDKGIKVVKIIPYFLSKRDLIIDGCESAYSEGNFDKAMEIGNIIPDYDDKMREVLSDILDICKAMQSGDWDKALKIADSIVDDACKSKALYPIYIALCKKQQFDKAMEAVNMMPFQSERDWYAYAFSIRDALYLIGNIDKIKEFITMISNHYNQRNMIKWFFQKFYEDDNFNKAIELANMNPDDKCKAGDFGKLIKAFSLCKSFNKAKELADIIPINSKTEHTLIDICKTLYHNENLDVALDIVKKIPCKIIKDKLLIDICSVLGQKRKFEKAIEVANMISHAFREENASMTLCRILAKCGNYDIAIEVANMITDELIKSEAIFDIFRKSKEHYNKSIQIANMIPNESLKSWAFLIICQDLSQKGNFDEALGLVNMITDEKIKQDALRAIHEALSKSKIA